MSIRQSAKIALASLAFALVSTHAVAEPVINKPAPTFSGKAADGSTINLADLKGKTVVLEWTNHECPYVVKHYDSSSNIPALQKSAAEKGFVWLQVISSAPGKQGHVDGATAISLNEKRGATPTNTILDAEGTIGKLYNAQTSPHFFIINPEGTLVYKGGVDSIKSNKAEDIPKATPYVKDALEALAAGKKVPNQSTAPYGCSIKYAG
ncbi:MULTISPECIES: redoxin domain-containing protein [Cellvibrio]|uniref:redoxin domain-containing protein n=1 Tax=Cellvibrio TaxID=10 RepID=UPI002B4C1F38|nr:redoxin domain-containing protein [Cellvibrio fontiphilus]